MSRISQSALSRRMPRILAYALADLFGLFCLILGGASLFTPPITILANFPRSTAEAYVCAAGGIVLMLWAMQHLIREIRQIGKQD